MFCFYSGYMSPEYAMEGQFLIKSDVYSFGVLHLEIVSSRKNTGQSDDITTTNLVGHVSVYEKHSPNLNLRLVSIH